MCTSKILAVPLLCLFIIICGSLEVVSYSISNKKLPITCIFKILETDKVYGKKLAIVHTSNDDVDDILQSISITNNYSVIVRSFAMDRHFIFYGFYIIIARDSNEMIFGLSCLTKDIPWNPYGKFIVYVKYLSRVEVQKILNEFWKNNVFNVVVLTSDGSSNRTAIYTYELSKENCTNFGKVIEKGNCKDANSSLNYYPEKMPEQLINCTITIVAKEDMSNILLKKNYSKEAYVSGLEQFALETVADIKGFKLNYKIMDSDHLYGIVYENGSVSGMLNYLKTGEADIAAGGYILIQNRAKVFDYIGGINYGTLMVFTPAVIDEVWKKVYRGFNDTIWGLILGAFFLTILLCICARFLFSSKPTYYDNLILTLKLWEFFYGVPETKLTKELSLKFSMICWIWFTYFIYILYNTSLMSLTSSYLRPKVEPHNISNTALKPCMSDAMRQFFEIYYNMSMPDLSDVKDCKFRHRAFHIVASSTKYYAVDMDFVYKSFEDMLVDDEGNNELDTWELSSNCLIVMLTKRGYPLKGIIQKLAIEMYETGLLKYHLNKIYKNKLTSIKKKTKHYQTLKLADFKIHFVVLILGMILSLLCLLFEILYLYKIKR